MNYRTEKIISFVCENAGVYQDEILNKQRLSEYVCAIRQLCWYLETLRGVSMADIANTYGRSRQGVINGVSVIKGILDTKTNNNLENEIRRLVIKYKNTYEK